VRQLRIGLAQINTTVGDFKGNTEKILKAIAEAKSLGVDLITFPELAICGYPPEDLLLKPQFIEENLKSLNEVVKHSTEISIIVGFADTKEDIYNAAAVIHNGKLVSVYHKIYLPNYGVFDENRYFQAGTECPVYVIAGVGVGINICEDIWYEAGPATTQAHSGAEVIVNISASPYYFGRQSFRERMLATRAADNVAIVAYNNLVGGQDELVFDGNSMVLDEQGRLIARAVFRTRLRDPRWRKATLLLEEQRRHAAKIMVSQAAGAALKPPLPQRKLEVYDPQEEVYDALVLGTRDYIRKNGIEKVVIGLSGGVDSSLVVAIAVDALGPSNVVGVAMPSRYSSPGSISDAELLAQNLSIKLLTVPIENVFQSYLETLVWRHWSHLFKGLSPMWLRKTSKLESEATS
jgi:NAD+ synthase (glutamine-hydrolysing)